MFNQGPNILQRGTTMDVTPINLWKRTSSVITPLRQKNLFRYQKSLINKNAMTITLDWNKTMCAPSCFPLLFGIGKVYSQFQLKSELLHFPNPTLGMCYCQRLGNHQDLFSQGDGLSPHYSVCPSNTKTSDFYRLNLLFLSSHILVRMFWQDTKSTILLH